MTDLVSRARSFAVAEHRRIDHRRKYNGKPYEVHLEAVASLVATVTDDPETIAAAWLHDIVEDTPVTLNEIEQAFGTSVAALVGQLTDVSRPGDGNRATRKAIDRSHLAAASPRAKAIKLADLIDNADDICRFDARFGQVYLTEMAALLEVLDEGHPTLLARARETLARWQKQLGAGVSDDAPDRRAYTPDDEEAASVWKLLNGFTVGDLVRPLDVIDEVHLRDYAEGGLPSDRRSGVVGLRSGRQLRGYAETRVGHDGRVEIGERRDLVDDQVIDHGASIPLMVHVLTRYDHAFVRVADQIRGVLTRSDLEKPIGRMWLFGIVMVVEFDFMRRIRARWPDGSWTTFLSPGRLDKARELRDERRRRGQDADLLDCLQLADKGLILINDPDVLRAWGHRSKKSAKAALQDVQSLRNHLVHSQGVVEQHWHEIARLSRRFDDGLMDHSRAAGSLGKGILDIER